MKNILVYIACLLLCSCTNEKKNIDGLKTLIQTTFDNELILEEFKELGLIDNDTIYFLQNDNLTFDNYVNVQGNSIVSFPKGYFQEKKSTNFVYLNSCIRNKNLALLKLTFYTNTNINVYLEKTNENWMLSDVTINKSIRLRNSKAVSLSFKIDSINIHQNDLNIKKIKKNNSLKDALQIMDNSEVVITDSLGYKTYNYSASKSDFFIHQIIFNADSLVVQVKENIDIRNLK